MVASKLLPTVIDAIRLKQCKKRHELSKTIDPSTKTLDVKCDLKVLSEQMKTPTHCFI